MNRQSHPFYIIYFIILTTGILEHISECSVAQLNWLPFLHILFGLWTLEGDANMN